MGSAKAGRLKFDEQKKVENEMLKDREERDDSDQ